MPRNFHRRVEVMFPIEAPQLKQRILKEIVPTYLRDNVRTRILLSDGSYTRAEPVDGQPRHRSQEEFLAVRGPLEEVAAGNGSENGTPIEYRAAPAMKPGE
jgi:polyphosphate kinase